MGPEVCAPVRHPVRVQPHDVAQASMGPELCAPVRPARLALDRAGELASMGPELCAPVRRPSCKAADLLVPFGDSREPVGGTRLFLRTLSAPSS